MEPRQHCLTREATRPPSHCLLGSDPAQPEDESAREGGGGGAGRGVGVEEERKPVPTLLLPPSVPPPSRDSTSHHLLCLGPRGSPEPGLPTLWNPSPPFLLLPSPRVLSSALPRAPLSSTASPGPWLLPRRAGPAPRLSPASRPQARPLLGLPTPFSSTFPLLPSNPGSCPARVSASSRFPRPHPRLSFPRAAAAAGAGSRERRRRRRGPRKAPGGGKRRVRRRQGGGKSGDQERAPPTTRAPGAAPDPGPALDLPQRWGTGEAGDGWAESSGEADAGAPARPAGTRGRDCWEQACGRAKPSQRQRSWR